MFPFSSHLVHLVFTYEPPCPDFRLGTTLGSPGCQVSGGSLANLTCVVRGAPSRVFWYKDGAVLGFVPHQLSPILYVFFLTFVPAVFHTFATIRYYSDRGTSVVRTLRPNLVASSLLIPNFSLADQVLEIFCTSFSILFL